MIPVNEDGEPGEGEYPLMSDMDSGIDDQDPSAQPITVEFSGPIIVEVSPPVLGTEGLVDVAGSAAGPEPSQALIPPVLPPSMDEMLVTGEDGVAWAPGDMVVPSPSLGPIEQLAQVDFDPTNDLANLIAQQEDTLSEHAAAPAHAGSGPDAGRRPGYKGNY